MHGELRGSDLCQEEGQPGLGLGWDTRVPVTPVSVCDLDRWVMCLLIGILVPLTLEQTLPSLGDKSCYIMELLTAQEMFVFTVRLVHPSGALT